MYILYAYSYLSIQHTVVVIAMVRNNVSIAKVRRDAAVKCRPVKDVHNHYCNPHCLMALQTQSFVYYFNLPFKKFALTGIINPPPPPPPPQESLHKWKNHFCEMKEDVGMSPHEKEHPKTESHSTPYPYIFMHNFTY